MKKLIFILCAVGLITASCNKNNGNDEYNGNATDLNGTWRMVRVRDNATGTIQSKPPAVKAEVEIAFSASGPAKGIITGNTPTNIIFGGEYTTGSDQSFILPCLSMTKVAENEWGILFVDHIRNSTKYTFESDGRLNITTTNKTLSFIKL